MIKTLRKLQGKRTHIANTVALAGGALAAAGLGVDPIALVAAATGSVDAITGIVSTVDAAKGIDWQQVGVGGIISMVGQMAVFYFRHIAKVK
jgi:hypothetical protein